MRILPKDIQLINGGPIPEPKQLTLLLSVIGTAEVSVGEEPRTILALDQEGISCQDVLDRGKVTLGTGSWGRREGHMPA